MKKTIWPIIIISYFSLFVFGISDNIRGPLFPEILNSFQLTDAMGSLMFSLSNLAGFIGSHFIRALLQRYNRKAVLQVGCIGLALSLLGLALSPHFSVFLFFSFTCGFTLGSLALIPNILVPLGSSNEKKAQFLSGLHAMYGVASFLAPLMIAIISQVSNNWRIIFAVTSLFPLLLLIYSSHSSQRDLYPKPVTTKVEYRDLRKKNLKAQIFLALMVSFNVSFEIMLSSRIALYMRRTMNFNLEDSSLYVTYFFICMLIGRLLFTFFKFNFSVEKQLSVSLVLSALCLYFGLYFHPFFLVLGGLSVAPFYPMAISFISEEFPEDLDAAVSYMIATDSIGLALMHFVVGKLTDLYNIHSAMKLGFLLLVISFLFLNSYHLIFKSKKLTKI